MAWDDELTLLAQERGSELVGYAYLLTGELQAAEDLVQESILRTYTRRRRETDLGSAEAYVRRTMVNLYFDGYRRNRRWWTLAPRLVTPQTQTGHEAVVTERTDVVAALRQLAPRQRTCVVLRFYEDLTVPAIAHRLDLSPGAVKRYLSEGLRRLELLLAAGIAPHSHDSAATKGMGR